MAGTLYVVGTPIGNLSDLSPRAVETLQAVDFIAAEDTRVTVKILNHFGIKKPQVSYYEHNLREKGEQIVQRLLAGESVPLSPTRECPASPTPARIWSGCVRSRTFPSPPFRGPARQSLPWLCPAC